MALCVMVVFFYRYSPKDAKGPEFFRTEGRREWKKDILYKRTKMKGENDDEKDACTDVNADNVSFYGWLRRF